VSETYFFDALSGARVVMNAAFGRGTRLRAEADLLATPARHVGDDWANSTANDNAPKLDLPDGVDERGGRYFADCCHCERTCDVTEFMAEAADIDFTQWHGGCGPSCCP